MSCVPVRVACPGVMCACDGVCPCVMCACDGSVAWCHVCLSRSGITLRCCSTALYSVVMQFSWCLDFRHAASRPGRHPRQPPDFPTVRARDAARVPRPSHQQRGQVLLPSDHGRDGLQALRRGELVSVGDHSGNGLETLRRGELVFV